MPIAHGCGDHHHSGMVTLEAWHALQPRLVPLTNSSSPAVQLALAQLLAPLLSSLADAQAGDQHARKVLEAMHSGGLHESPDAAVRAAAVAVAVAAWRRHPGLRDALHGPLLVAVADDDAGVANTVGVLLHRGVAVSLLCCWLTTNRTTT